MTHSHNYLRIMPFRHWRNQKVGNSRENAKFVKVIINVENI